MPATTLKHPVGGLNAASPSLSALREYLLPPLDRIFKSPTDDPNGEPPPLDFAYYMGVYTACVNYITKPSANAAGRDLFALLDGYFQQAAMDLLLQAPSSGIALIQYLVSSFNRYHAAASLSGRLMKYYERHWVRREVDEGRGWFQPTVDMGMTPDELDHPTFKNSKKYRKKKLEELRKWGYKDGDSSEQIATFEKYAEAASPLNRAVPVASMAHRRFRTELIEPLLEAPHVVSPSTNPESNIENATSDDAGQTKGRLFSAVEELLAGENLDQGERIRLATGLANMLKVIGLEEDYVLRKKLDDYIYLHLSTTPQTLIVV
ncbi:hypothetical protein D9613_009596 [Agrocybe pediades]|uniref:Uncharacterized protein n=1 Tax=Agrocybe pediades TaxID=84607 RepID=A0A8H4R3X7_9AGAR|nr:hypothetical protein D9613_009596 [Agrocybe pediades]